MPLLYCIVWYFIMGGYQQPLTDLGSVLSLVVENIGEVSDHWYQLLAALATSWVQITGGQRERRGLLRSEDTETA